MNTTMDSWERTEGASFLRRVGLDRGHRVMDFGARVGHYSIPAARVVGDNGIVWAVDKDRGPLEELEERASSLGISNIRPLVSSGEPDFEFKTSTVDAVLVYDVLHYMDRGARRVLYRNLGGILKEGGLLSVYPKHVRDDLPLGEFSGLSREDLISEIRNASFSYEDRICGMISHDDDIVEGCILNFRK